MATIILLALTVVLFGSIFAWVTNFPPPIQQNVTQFSANMVLAPNQTYVAGLEITHLAGPSVTTSSTYVYLKSAYHPGAPEFQNPIAVAPYLPNSVTWNLGQTFNYTFPCPVGACEQPQLPDNLTVLVVSSDQLIFSTILPGTIIAVPPTFVATTVSPANPSVGASFTITATVAGNTGGNKVYVNLASIPGLSSLYPTAQRMTFLTTTNRWSFTVPASETTTNGTYYAFVNVTNNAGQAATAGVAVTFGPSTGGGGGGGSSSSLSVAVLLTPQYPPSPGSADSLAAIVTYPGTQANVGVSVAFNVSQNWGASGGWPSPAGSVQSLSGPSGLTISGPSTITVYATSSFSAWYVNASGNVTATATLSGVGSASGSVAFNTSESASGFVYLNPPSLSPFLCTLSTGRCPDAAVSLWNNASVGLTFSGPVNLLYGSNPTPVHAYTMPPTTVASDSTVTWQSPHFRVVNSGQYHLVAELTVTSSSGTLLGYLYLTYGFSA